MAHVEEHIQDHIKENVPFQNLQADAKSQLFAAAASVIIMLIIVLLRLCNMIPFPLDVAWTFFATSAASVVLYSWVLAAADLDTMKLRLEYGTVSNTLITSAFCVLCFRRVEDTPLSGRIALVAGATFIPPLAHCRGARSFKSSSSWAVGLALHFGIVMHHHWHSMSEGWQWLAVLLVIDVLVLDNTQTKLQAQSLVAELEEAYERMAEMSNKNSRKLFEDFCDADVLLNSDGEVCGHPSRLATILGKSERGLQGVSFTSLLSPEDIEKFNSFMEYVIGEVSSGSDATEQSAHSLRVDMEGLYGIKIPVVLFHAQYRTTEVDTKWISWLGITEAWQPKKAKTKQTARGTGNQFHQPLEEQTKISKRPQSQKRLDSPRPG